MKRLHSDDEEPSSSAQTVASIDDLLIHILSRFRLNTLIRFKTVSKRWNSIISNLKHDPEPAVGLIVYPTNSDRFFAYFYPFNKSDRPSFLPDHTDKKNVAIKILHGCNGLLLYSATENKNTNIQYFVVNPTTMKRRTMLPEPMHPERILAMCLAFNPSKSPRYKVVCITGRKSNNNEHWYDRFQVYSSETGSWRYATMHPFIGLLDVENGVYWNGALHWIPVSSVSNSIYFDPEDEDHQMYQMFPTPPTPTNWNTMLGYNKYFGESCGHLHFVGQGMTEELRVYEMKTDYSEWFVKYRLRHSMHRLIRGRLNGWGSHRICALFRGEKDEDCFLVLWDKRRITRYNIVSGAFEIFHEFPHSFIRAPLPYFESICYV